MDYLLDNLTDLREFTYIIFEILFANLLNFRGKNCLAVIS